MVRDLSETKKGILLYLSTMKEANKYQISEGINKAYSGVHKATPQLLQLKYIEISQQKKGKRNFTVKSDYYTLTRIGLLNVLYLDEPWKNFAAIIEPQKDKLPLILGKWNLFEEHNVADIVIGRLKHGIVTAYRLLENVLIETYVDRDYAEVYPMFYEEFNTTLSEEMIIERKNNIKNLKLMNSDIETILNLSILRFPIWYNPNTREEDKVDQMKLLKAIKKDSDIFKYYLEWIDYFLNQKKKQINDLENWRHTLENFK